MTVLLLTSVWKLQSLFIPTMKEINNVKQTPNARKNSKRYANHQPFRLCHFKFRYTATNGSINISLLFWCKSVMCSNDFSSFFSSFDWFFTVMIELKSNWIIRPSDSKSSSFTPSLRISMGSLLEHGGPVFNGVSELK